MFTSIIIKKYCEKIGLKNYLRKLSLPISLAFIFFLIVFGRSEFKNYSFENFDFKIFIDKIWYVLFSSYLFSMTVPAIEDFIACRRNEIRPFFIDVHSGLITTRISVFELMLWITRFGCILALSATFVYTIPYTIIYNKIKEKRSKKMELKSTEN